MILKTPPRNGRLITSQNTSGRPARSTRTKPSAWSLPAPRLSFIPTLGVHRAGPGQAPATAVIPMRLGLIRPREWNIPLAVLEAGTPRTVGHPVRVHDHREPSVKSILLVTHVLLSSKTTVIRTCRSAENSLPAASNNGLKFTSELPTPRL